MPASLWLCLFSGVGVGYAFMSISPVSDQFMALFGVGYAGLGLLLSGLLWSHSLGQIPAGLLIDRIGAYRGFCLGAVIGIAGNILPFFDPGNLTLAIAMRFLLGASTAILFLAVVKILGLVMPPGQMAKAQGFYGGAFGFGTMLPYFTLPHLESWGWGYSYVITGCFFAAMLVGTLCLPREQLEERSGGAQSESVPIRVVFTTSVASPDLWMLGLFHGVFYGTLNNLGQWLPAVLADLAKAPLAAWGLAATVALFLGSCSRTLSGYFLKLLPRRNAISLCLFTTFVLYTAMGTTDNVTLGLVAGLCLALGCGLCHGAVFAMGGMVLPAAFMGTAIGFLNSLANLFNVGLTLSFGYLREATGSFSVPLCMTGLVALALLLASRRRLTRLDARVQPAIPCPDVSPSPGGGSGRG